MTIQARIYRRAKNPMQSGRARTDKWALEFERQEPQSPDPLTGWAGSGDTRGQVRLTFATLEDAQAYAAKQGFDTVIVPSEGSTLKLQTYADNFK